MLKKYILTFFISMVPIIELRAGIPAGVLMGVDWKAAVAICMVGNMVPVPVIFFFARKVLEWGKDKKYIGKFFTFCLEKGHHGGEKLKAKAGDKGIYYALLLFVGIPLPGTGAWTGTLAASLLDLDFKKSIAAVVLGVMLAAVIITVLTLMGVMTFTAN
ncbi:MAG: small multi-drug export protein [Ruminococcus sp.]|nr:small multi-drug export protein [Ruminococcus sp.]